MTEHAGWGASSSRKGSEAVAISRSGRRTLAWAAVVPLIAVGLVGCQTEADTSEKRPKSTKGEAGGPTGTSEAGGGLPFGDDTTDSSQPTTTSSPSSKPSASPNASNPGSGGGTDVVKWDGVDLSSVNWKITCYLNESPSIYGQDADAAPASIDAASLMVTTDDQGAVDWLMVSSGTDTSQTLYFAKSADASQPEHGKADITVDGGRITVTGEAFEFTDFSYNTPMKFELQLECDEKY